MDAKLKIENEIARKKKIIEDCENIMEKVPKHLRSSQETSLEIYKRELEALAKELAKIESMDILNK